MELVERVRLLCKERGIAISKIEKDLGYGNGYFNPKKLKNIPSDRLVEIAEYLNMSVNELLELGQEPAPEDHSGKKAYYLDPEAAEMAQELFENPDMRVLFDAARDITPDQLKAVGNMVEAMRKKEEGDFDEPC